MTLGKLIHTTELIDVNTEIFIRDKNFKIVAHGRVYEDNIKEYMLDEIESFTWQNDNKTYINLL